jgi:hypothetical protein
MRARGTMIDGDEYNNTIISRQIIPIKSDELRIVKWLGIKS